MTESQSRPHDLPQQLESMVSLDLATELRALRDEASWLRGRATAKTLVKAPELRVTLVALKAGARVDEHAADGPVTIHGLQGRLRLTANGAATEIVSGQLLVLPAQVRHQVDAIEDSAFLLTLGWRQGRQD